MNHLIRLTGILCITAIVVAQTTESRVVRVKLNDGTVLTGPVVSEDDAQITIIEELAGGTIQSKRVIKKSDIAEVASLPEEELRARALKAGYAETLRYRLDPNTSYQEKYYTDIIDRVLQPFVTKFPDAPQAAEINAKIAAWESERQQVAAGMAKFRGQWMKSEDVTALTAKENVGKIMEQARALLAQQRFSRAIETAKPLNSPEAKQLINDAYLQWLAWLQAQQLQASNEVQNAQQRLTRAQQTASQAKLPGSSGSTIGSIKENTQQKIGKRGGNESGTTARLGDGSSGIAEVTAYNKAQQELKAAQENLQNWQTRLNDFNQEIVRIKPLSSVATVTATGSQVVTALIPTNGPPSLSSPGLEKDQQYAASENPPMLQRMGAFFRYYWPFIVLAVVVGAWVVTRKLAK